MMRPSSTALANVNDWDLSADQMPIIQKLAVESSNAHDDAFDTSGAAAQTKIVHRRRQPSDQDSPSLSTETERLNVLKSWEGIVTVVAEDSFFASMRPLDSRSNRAEDELEIDLDNVAQGDRDLVREGAIFYLTVGIRRPRGEGPQKTTRLIFRRMPRWSRRDIARAENDATELWKKLSSGLIAQQTGSLPEAR